MSLPSELLPVGLLGTSATAAAGYSIERSLRFNSADSAYLDRTPSTAGNRNTWTWSAWVKLAAIADNFGCFFDAGTGSVNNNFRIHPEGDITFRQYNGSSTVLQLATTQLFRDYSAWYHLVLVYDSSNATSSDRVRLYVNGARITAFATATYPSSNLDSYVNSTNQHRIGTSVSNGSTRHFDGYLADIHFIDGQALDPTSFGEFDADTGIWNPIAYTGGYGLVSVASATGALPIYNTTDTHGAVKGTGTRTDTNASSLVLALPLFGNADDVSNQINSGSTTKTITASGDAAASSAQSKFYGGSYYFDGTGDLLTVTDNADFDFGSDDFTIEFWSYATDVGTFISWGEDASNRVDIGPRVSFGSGGYRVLVALTGQTTITLTTNSYSSNKWVHNAIVRYGNTIYIYLDGVVSGSGSWTAAMPTASATGIEIGARDYGTGPANYMDGYIQDLRIYKGVAKYTTNFTVTSGPNNSFHLPFSDNSSAAALGDDTSGNNNDWTVNNISVASGAGNDSLVDSPTNGTQTDTGLGGEVVGNYCTFNPLSTNSNNTLSNGNLDATGVVTGSSYNVGSTFGLSSGKWYWEITAGRGSGSNNGGWEWGVAKAPFNPSSTTRLTASPYGWGVNGNDGGVYSNNSSLVSGYISGTAGSVIANGDTVMVAYDATNGNLWLGKNGTWGNNGGTGDPAAGTNAAVSSLTGTFFPVVTIGSDSGTPSAILNAGARPFAYSAPSGFKALCTSNLPAPTVEDGSTAMDVVTYTGNGSSRSITGIGFSPDLIWTKQRSGSSTAHSLHDIIRGTNKHLTSNGTDLEVDVGQYGGGITAFNSDGYSLGTWGAVNENTQTYVAWTWDAGSSTVSNTDGSITSSVRANPTAGFSIVTYEPTSGWTSNANATVGHGLGVKPALIIAKNTERSVYWSVYHSALGAAKWMRLNTTDTAVTTTVWGNPAVEPTSTVFTFGDDFSVGYAANEKIVAYCFAPVESYSAFGSYTGNASTDGPFVFTGFRPRWLMIKNTSSIAGIQNYASWLILDTQRDSYNVSRNTLWANKSVAEDLRGDGSTAVGSNCDIDICSNGFKIRTGSVETNGSGNTMIWAAFAENPFALNARAR